MVKLSVVVTAYQAQDTIGRAVRSVLDTPRRNEMEIIVVDDCSSDNTTGVIRDLQRQYKNISLYTMPCNSGSPSGPRNLGIEKAAGEYVTVLDDDDLFRAGALLDMVDEAIRRDLDFVKGFLIIDAGGKTREANRLPGIPKDGLEAIRDMLMFQSLADFVVRRSLVVENGIRYDPELKIGEDTDFVTALLARTKKAAYIDKAYKIHHKDPVDVQHLSSTQRWGDRELLNQIEAWRRAQRNLQDARLDFYSLRLCAALRNVLVSLVRFSDGISEETYEAFYQFVCETQRYTSGGMNLSERYRQVYDAVMTHDYAAFLKAIRRRLLINGYDLKFILPVVPYLKSDYEIQVDEWTGHNSHDETRGRELSKWADIIWCEWMLGNAVFYSRLVNGNQRLVIRAHRFEISREFGDQIDFRRVNAVFAVGYYYFEQFYERFSIPRSRMRLLNNYVENAIYSKTRTDNARYHIGMVGILPSRKGFLRALKLLKRLLRDEPGFKLYIMGRTPGETPWIRNNPQEKAYYDGCEQFIREECLTDHIVYGGYVERRNLYRDIGYVLSLSDAEQPESFHLSPAEAVCAGCMTLMLRWPGVEYLYPPQIIFENMEDIALEIIRAAKDEAYFYKRAAQSRQYILENYSMEAFLNDLRRYLLQVRLME